MGQWVVTVAGIAILSVLCDVILPQGQTRKYVKSVFGIVVTLVIIQPVIALLSGDYRLSWSMSNDVSSDIQQQYIESVESRQNEISTNLVKSMLDANDVAVDSIVVSQVNKTVTLQLGVKYSTQLDAKVKEVVGKYFPNYEIVSVWKQ